jgi:hypothetical protein
VNDFLVILIVHQNTSIGNYVLHDHVKNAVKDLKCVLHDFIDAVFNPNMGGSGGCNDDNDAVKLTLSCDTTLFLF